MSDEELPTGPVSRRRLYDAMLDGNEATPQEVESMCVELLARRDERERLAKAAESLIAVWRERARYECASATNAILDCAKQLEALITPLAGATGN